MNRRDWLKRTALLAAGTIAADQLELLDRLGWTRTVFPSISLGADRFHYDLGFLITEEMLEDIAYVHYMPAPHLITPCNKEAPCTKTTR